MLLGGSGFGSSKLKPVVKEEGTPVSSTVLYPACVPPGEKQPGELSQISWALIPQMW